MKKNLRGRVEPLPVFANNVVALAVGADLEGVAPLPRATDVDIIFEL